MEFLLHQPSMYQIQAESEQGHSERVSMDQIGLFCNLPKQENSYFLRVNIIVKTITQAESH